MVGGDIVWCEGLGHLAIFFQRQFVGQQGDRKRHIVMAQKSGLVWGVGVLVVGIVAGAIIWQMSGENRNGPGGAKIGGLLPLTGSLAAFGGPTLTGIELAVMEVNQAGGVLGGELVLVVADTETSPQAGVTAAHILVDVEGVSGIVGAMASGVTIPVAQSIAAVAGVPILSPSATSPVITILNDNDFLFRTTPNDADQGVQLAHLVTAQGLENVVVLFRNDDYGRGLSEAFFVNFSGHVNANIGYEPDQSSYRAELAGAAASGDSEALVLIAFPEEGIPILRQSLEEGYFESFVFTDGMKANDVVDAVGQQYLEHSFGIAPMAVESEALSNYRALYEANTGSAPTDQPFVENAYDGALLLALAIEKAGSKDPVAVRDALRAVANPPGEIVLPGEFARGKSLIAAGTEINYEGAAGAQDFDVAGDVSGTFGSWAFRDGKVENLSTLGD